MIPATNNKDLIIITRREYEIALKKAYDNGFAAAKKAHGEKETVSKAKSEITTSKGAAKVRKAVVDSDE